MQPKKPVKVRVQIAKDGPYIVTGGLPLKIHAKKRSTIHRRS